MGNRNLRLKINKLIFIIIFLSMMPGQVVIAASDIEEKQENNDPFNRRMGIEIETSTIKIHSPTEDKIGFRIFSADAPLWIMEEDTSDETFKHMVGFSHFNRNLELKTVGGLTEEQIKNIGGKMQILLNYIHTHEGEILEIDPHYLQQVFRSSTIEPYMNNPSKILIKAKPDDTLVRPQISYQMPLFLLPRVFEHLAELNHKKIRNFLDCLNPEVPEDLNPPNIQRKLDSPLVARKNVGLENYAKLFLKSRVAQIINNVEPQTNVKGFCYLFTYYWYSLFNSKKSDEDLEQGPKQFLAILSRVPISQIFDKLTIEEQEAVRNIFDPVFSTFEVLPDINVSEHPFTLIQYENYSGMVNSTLTVIGWYHSITDAHFRKVKEDKFVDLLSPPPGFDDINFSMGYLDMDTHSSGLPLFEVRGYATISYKNHPPQISDIRGIIKNESNWFFNILG